MLEIMMIVVDILLSILLALHIPIREDLSDSLRMLAVVSATVGLVVPAAGLLEHAYWLTSTIPTIDEIPTYILKTASLPLLFIIAWLQGSIISFISASITYLTRLINNMESLTLSP